MEITIWHMITFVVFIALCAYYNYKSGVEHGINATLDTLEKTGLIDITGTDIKKAVAKINENEN
jgi:hypothetical protein